MAPRQSGEPAKDSRSCTPLVVLLFVLVCLALAWPWARGLAGLASHPRAPRQAPPPLVQAKRGKARTMAVDVDASGRVHVAVARDDQNATKAAEHAPAGRDATTEGRSAVGACPSRLGAAALDVPRLAEAELRRLFAGHMDFASHKQLKAMEHDDAQLFRLEGGDNRSHTYGECYPEAMWQILEAAACALGCPSGAAAKLPGFRFYDLGSGYGKFPMFAALAGCQAAVGIELDSARHEVAAARLAGFERLGCSELAYRHESFTLADTPWRQGPEPRILFLDAVCWDKQMPEIASMMRTADFGPDSVVAIMGKAFGPDAGLEAAREPLRVKVSWGHSTVRFYRKASPAAPVASVAALEAAARLGVVAPERPVRVGAVEPERLAVPETER